MTSTTTQAYPLQWPIGWPRTSDADRTRGQFSKKKQTDQGELTIMPVTLQQSLNRVLLEMRRFTRPGSSWRIDPDSVVISTNLKVRVSDGRPKSGQRQPEDPGVAVYFELDGKPQVIPSDAYTKLEQNLAAVAATLDALRALERHGSGIMERAFTGFEALPHLAEEPWHVVLGIPEDAPISVIEAQGRKLRSAYHPDRPNGDATQFDRVVKAFAAAKGARAAVAH